MLAKMAFTLAKLGDFNRADSAYHAWQEIEYEGNHARDSLIVGYLRARGRYAEAAKIYNDLIRRVRLQGDTLGEMMSSAKWGLAIVCQKTGHTAQAADLYSQVLEIQDTLKQRQALNTAQELAAVYHAHEQELAIEQEKAENTRNRSIIIVILTVLIAIAIYTVKVVRQKRVISQKNQSLAAQISQAMNYKELYNKERAKSALLSIAHSKSTDKTDDEPDIDTLDDEQLFQYINDIIVRERLFLDSKFDRQTIMGRFHLSKDRVGAAFSKGSHYAKLTDYTQELRLEYATLLLANNPDMNVTQVATESGFSSSDYFGRCFRKRFGMTPTEFRTSALPGT